MTAPAGVPDLAAAPASSKGLGSARPKTEERFDAATHTTFDGRALAIIRPVGEGAIEATVSAEGCEDVTIAIDAHRVNRE